MGSQILVMNLTWFLPLIGEYEYRNVMKELETILPIELRRQEIRKE